MLKHSIFCLLGVVGLTSAMVTLQLPSPGPNTERNSSPTVHVDFISGSLLYSLKGDLSSPKASVFFPANELSPEVISKAGIKQVVVNAAEAGMSLQMFVKSADTKPAVSLVTNLAILSSDAAVVIDMTTGKNTVIGNVNVIWNEEAAKKLKPGEGLTFEKVSVEISMPGIL